MSQILIGAVAGLLFFVALILSFYLGYRFGKKTKPEAPQLTEEQKQKFEKMQKGWQNILNYDVATAMKRGGMSG